MDAIRLLAAVALLISVTSVRAQLPPSPFPSIANGVGGPGGPPTPAATPTQPNRIVKNLRDFVIPFELAPDSRDVREVHLHISVDQGKNWQLHQRQMPSTKNFPFRASRDGEYWFAVRTVGRQQDQPGNLNLRPELIVVVDTQPPRLNLRLQHASDGQVLAEWYVQDDHLRVDSFQLQLQDQNGNWQPIPFDKPNAASPDLATQWKSQTTWRPLVRGTEVLVRAEVFDQAENAQVVQKQISVQGAPPRTLDPVAQNLQTAPASSTVGQKWEDLESEFRGSLPADWNNQADRSTLSSRGTVWDAEPRAGRQPSSRFDSGVTSHREPLVLQDDPAMSATDRSPYARSESSSRSRFDRTQVDAPDFTNPSQRDFTGGNRDFTDATRDSSEANRDFPSTTRDFRDANRDVPDTRRDFSGTSRAFSDTSRDFSEASRDFSEAFDRSANRNDRFGTPNWGQSEERSTDREFSSTRERPGSWPNWERTDSGPVATSRDPQRQMWEDPRPFNVRRPIASRIERSVAEQRAAVNDTDNTYADAMFQPRISSTPNFELVYDVYGVRRGEARQVELWFTRDQGRSWQLYGRDADQTSPMQVRVASEGLYGFQLTVDTGRGQTPTPPQAGDRPDVWVIVDWTKPSAEIVRVQMPDGVRSREIRIEWTASDSGLLAEAPISISCADNPNGPWSYLAKEISNAGAYDWLVDRRLPDSLFFRLEVRDVVGNVATHIFDGLGGPRSRIVDVRPIR